MTAATSPSAPPPRLQNGHVDSKEKEVETSAPPPKETMALVAILLALLIPHLPAGRTLDETANLSVFSHCTYSEVLSSQQLGYIRWAIAIIIWATSIHTVLFQPSYTYIVSYLPNSKLQRLPFSMAGVKTMALFTSWCWNLLGIYFTLSGFIAMYQIQNKFLLRLTLVAWEIAAPNTLLVATMVRYVIWPRDFKHGNTRNLKRIRNLLMHNANVGVLVLEEFWLGAIPMQRWADMTLVILWGLVYVVFSWSMRNYWLPGRPQFLYFFLDTTLGPWHCSKIFLQLLAVQCTFYGLFVWIARSVVLDDYDLFPRIAISIAATSLIMGSFCRFRD